jgi:hypothetical protein
MSLQNPLVAVQSHDLGNQICTLYAGINAATYELLEMLARFDEQRLYAREGCLTSAHWLQYRCGINPGAAREKVRVARALLRLPKIDRAFSEGSLSYSKARALTRAATLENEASLLKIARHSTAAQTERILKDYRQVVRRHTRKKQITALGVRPEPDQKLTCYWNEAGDLVVKAILTSDQGALLLKSIEHAQEEMSGYGVESEEPLASRRALGLVLIAERSLAEANVSGSSADRFQVSVHMTTEAVTHAPGIEAANEKIDRGPVLSRETAERLLCDASIVTYESNSSGNPLNVGRKTRVISSPMRRALHKRDGGCRFPGCTQFRFVDAHHIKHWARGGETKLSNLVLLCRHHHRLVHEKGYRASIHRSEVQFH